MTANANVMIPTRSERFQRRVDFLGITTFLQGGVNVAFCPLGGMIVNQFEIVIIFEKKTIVT